jgi:hypothetical protein
MALIAALLASLQAPHAVAQQEDAKWFVLRQETTGYCWMALLIGVNGEYVHSFAKIASKPFGTKGDALAREQDLEKSGSCAKAP